MMAVFLDIFGGILTCLVFIVIRWIIRRRSIHRSLKKYGIPGPKPDFLGGNMYQLKKEPTPNGIIDAWLKEYGDVFGYFIGENIYVVIKDLEMLKKVFIKDIYTFINKPKFLQETEPNPKTLPGLRDKRWKEVRNIVTPAFTTGKVKHLTDVVSRKVNTFVELIMKKANDNEIFNIHELVQGLTLDVISACAFAMSKNVQENPNDDLLQAMRNIFKYQFNRVEEIGTVFPFLSKFLHIFDDFFPFKKSLNTVVDHLKTVMKVRRQNPNLRTCDIFQVLLDSCSGTSEENKTQLTEEEAIANVLIVLLAGFNTTSNTIGFIFYSLTMHPEVQDRLYQEILEAKDTSYSTLTSLTYLDQVCSEALRLYPAVSHFIIRECNSDYNLGPYTIPKEATVVAPIWSIQRDPNLWPDPLKFDPERFSPTNKGSIKNMSYFPFGIGARKCVGMLFAQLEIKMAIYKVLQKVKLVPCDKTEDPLQLIVRAFTMYPTNGVWVKAIPRDDD